MENGRTDNRKQQLLTAALLTLLLAFVLALRFDYFFDLNDDVLMKDIVAGVYTGAPEGRNIQMLFPVSAFISLFYRLSRSFDWYGFFLLFCQFGSIALILYRGLTLAKSRTGKALAAAGTLVCAAALLLPHLLYVQYTLTCAMLCAAAAFSFATMEMPGEETLRLSGGAARVWLFPALLLWIAFFIRSEMTLLLLPLVMTGLLFRLLFVVRQDSRVGKSDNEPGNREGENEDQAADRLFEKIVTPFSVRVAALVFLLTGAGIAFGLGADYLATASPDWRAFRSYFNARTELYDFYFYDMPEYGENPGFYEAAGIDEAGASLLKNYNFSLDPSIDGEKLWTLVGQARIVHDEKSSPAGRIRDAAAGYIYRIRHLTDAPYSILVLIGYLLVLAQTARRQDGQTARRGLFAVIFLFFVRTGLWGYILYRGRDPERIIHSLFLLEFVLLAALLYLLRQGREKTAAEAAEAVSAETAEASAPEPQAGHASSVRRGLYFALWVLAAAAMIPGQYRRCVAEGERRDRVNAAQEAYDAYCDEHPDEIFFTDVYSTVRYSQKMFDRRGMSGAFSNRDLMGGWAAKSPLYEKRMAALGLADMQGALAENDRVYFVSAPSRDPGWLAAYYEARGMEVTVEERKKIGEDWIVYRVEKK